MPRQPKPRPSQTDSTVAQEVAQDGDHVPAGDASQFEGYSASNPSRGRSNQEASESPKKPYAKSQRSPKSIVGADTSKRLNQLLASAGFGSRRQCEELIREGRVMVDGEIVTKLSVTLEPKDHKVIVDGIPLKPQKLVYYAVHKPKGVVSTNSDPQGRPRVIDLVPPTERVYPVGRLDRNSDGLILLTNDGDLAQQLAHPRFGVTKVYRVTVAGEVKAETMRKMREGIYIAEGLVKVDGAKVLKARKSATDMEIRLREGKNREIRRILAKFGHKVQTLRRIAIGPLRLGDVPAGAYRKLSHVEIEKLRNIAQQAAAAPADDETDRPTKRKTSRVGKGSKPVKRAGQSARPRGSGSRPPEKAIAEARQRPVTKNRRPVKQKRSTPVAAGRDSLRVGNVIMGDEFASLDPKPKAKEKNQSAKKARKKPTRASEARKRKGQR